MNILSRFRFLIGIVFVVLIVVALVLYLNYSMSIARASKAELAADTSSIGTDYAGLVVKQSAEVGDRVTKGQTLFELQSSKLAEELDNKSVTEASLSFDVDPDTQHILLKANNDGVVDKINYRVGSFVPTGGVIATVNMVDSIYATGYFQLSPPDYARINKDNKVTVTLPDNSTREATIFSISLVRSGDNVDTVVKARLKGADLNDVRFSVGTPVEARLRLGEETWYQSLSRYVTNLLQPGAER
ncbi:p-hydroxybenzoic acid efflux subunit AaeA [compost metagenome]